MSLQINDTSCTDVRTDIKGFSVEGQKDITQLPINIGRRFPDLEVYDAGSCSIKKISKSNFAYLIYLRKLWLGFNEITEIPDDVFEDLVSLDYLAIGKRLFLFTYDFICSIIIFPLKTQIKSRGSDPSLSENFRSYLLSTSKTTNALT